MLKRLFDIIACILFSGNIYAQFSEEAPDSNLTSLQNYRPGYGAFFYQPHLGNTGNAFYMPYYTDTNPQLFRLGMNQYANYEYNPGMNKQKITLKNFSELKYFTGSNKEQYFTIKHFQKISNSLSAGLDFRTANSPGYYKSQKGNLRNFNIYTAYNSSNKKYAVMLNYLSNRIISQENGGIRDEINFYNAQAGEKKTSAVNLDDAVTKHAGRIFYGEQVFHFLKSDSAGSKKRKNISLSHRFYYDAKSVLFTAGKFYPDFFRNVYYDSTKTYDSLYLKNFYNELTLETSNIFSSRFTFYIQGTHQVFDYSQMGSDTILRDFSVSGGAKFDLDSSLTANFSIRKNFNALPQNYHAAYFDLQTHLLNKLKVALSASYEKRHPDFIYTYYNSNHFLYNRQLNPVNIFKSGLNAEAEFPNQKLSAGLNYFLINNHVFFDTGALPNQFSNTIHLLNFEIYHHIKLGSWNLIDRVKLEKADNEEILRVPLAATYTSLFYEHNFYKKALTAQFGFDLRYSTEYFANAYMPATGQFYLQNEKQTGNYPYLDVFINFRISNVRISLKSEHVNAGLLKRTYSLIPDYPLPGRTLRVGIVWDFFN